MKLEFIKLADDCGAGPHIEDHKIGKLFEVFMNGFVCFVGKCSKDFKISYNFCYHSYCLDLWQICGNRGDSIKQFEEVYNWFVKNDYYIYVDGTTWNNNHHDDLLPTVYGISMTIYPKEVRDQTHCRWTKSSNNYRAEMKRREKHGFNDWINIKEKYGLHPERFGVKHRVRL